ncbi:lysine biosynthesis protein LysX [Aureimonas sp. SA4125]|uniref:ATP-grasp domain-containing protein n=1 Tax=Aureimonas sp. SA4125 TaxID=2826993 RepID=UPI001CC5F625|nr:RimK family alpha-L-glutamate ligase [Aureimonas sp. SA4125]BDA86312.1 lysine biosynthesis protein LysX [Aureimonas sp. SA4125]
MGDALSLPSAHSQPLGDRTGTPPRIALVTADLDRHARDLLKAFKAAGARVKAIELADIAYDSEARHGLVLPHFGEDLPDAVCVRTMDGGSFEQVTRRLGILHALSELGVLVSNDARAIERCVDKSMTSFLLARAGLPSPRSWTVESRDAAAAIIASEPGPLVLKPLFGAQGKGLKLVRGADDLPADEAIAGVYYLQRFAGRREGGLFTDYRILVSNGRIAATMMRQAGQWITNIKQGAVPLPMPADPELESLALAATRAVGGDFCGVDLLRDAEGAAQVIEVNSMPAWTGLEKASGVDVPALRARDLLDQLGPARQPRARSALARAV